MTLLKRKSLFTGKDRLEGAIASKMSGTKGKKGRPKRGRDGGRDRGERRKKWPDGREEREEGR